jgi:undecaprenyl phosphate N,N'-diacetylbacillosamine 1-phosphate transferase
MVNKSRDLSIQTLNSDPEITKVGRIIRRIKIDELPQLINVFLGDMSLVGPRPCLPSLQASFNVNGKKRLEVKPGITGLAQINGNIYLTWEDRWKFDALYVKNQSFFLDFKILLKTVLIVIIGEKRGLEL